MDFDTSRRSHVASLFPSGFYLFFPSFLQVHLSYQKTAVLGLLSSPLQCSSHWDSELLLHSLPISEEEHRQKEEIWKGRFNAGKRFAFTLMLLQTFIFISVSSHHIIYGSVFWEYSVCFISIIEGALMCDYVSVCACMLVRIPQCRKSCLFYL